MRVIRTFHPIGQGAFYTEVFRSATKRHFVMVYDCGSETADSSMDLSLDAQINLFKNSLGRQPKIDLLFISHFHADHIKGVSNLIAGVKVDKTVIPMLDWPTITLTRVRNFLLYYSNNPQLALDVDGIIQELYLNEGGSDRFGEVQVVSPDTIDERGEEDNAKGAIVSNVNRILSGTVLAFDKIWEYVPFNSITFNDPRAQALLNGLMALSGVTNPRQLDLEDLVRNRLNDVKKEYKKAMGNANDNLYTLVVESRPTQGVNPQPSPRLSHCMYFGDFDSKKNVLLWERFNKVFNYGEVGTVQVPHHGAKGNWRKTMCLGDPRHYIVSTGSTNGHHHPSYWVLQDIWNGGHRPYVVSEKIGSIKEYVFRIV